EVLPKHRQLLGPRHSEVLLATRNVVIAKRKLGRYDEARDEASRHLDNCKQRLGVGHEHTLAAMTSHGNALRDTGDLPAARKMVAAAFDRYSEGDAFGAEHPFTYACAINLAIILRHSQEYRAALTMNERTRAGLITALGENHPATLCCSANLSSDLSMLHE